MINQQVGEEIEPGAAKSVSVNLLLPFLNEKYFSFFEGKAVNEDTKQKFIDRLINKRNQFGVNSNQLYRRTRKEPLEISPDVKRKLDYQTAHDALYNNGIIPGLKHYETIAPFDNEYLAVHEPQNAVYMSKDKLEELVNNENEQQRNNQSDFLLNSLMNRHEQERLQMILDGVIKFNEVSIAPIRSNELNRQAGHDIRVLLRRLVDIQTHAPSQWRATSKKRMGDLVRIVLDLRKEVRRFIRNGCKT